MFYIENCRVKNLTKKGGRNHVPPFLHHNQTLTFQFAAKHWLLQSLNVHPGSIKHLAEWIVEGIVVRLQATPLIGRI